MIYVILIIIYILIAWFTYNKVTSKWEQNNKAENIYFSTIWPLIIPLYIVHKIN